MAGSLIGGIRETQEVLGFCAEHDIHPVCEMIPLAGINEAFRQLAKGDIAHRFVIDLGRPELSCDRRNRLKRRPDLPAGRGVACSGGNIGIRAR